MNLKKRITFLLIPLVLSALFALPASAQTGRNFDLGDLINIGANGNNHPNGGINSGAVMGIANILYQVTQRNRNDGYYNNGGGYYPNNNGGYYPNNNGGYYPNGGGYYPNNNGGYYPSNNGGYYPTNNGGGYYPNGGGYYPNGGGNYPYVR